MLLVLMTWLTVYRLAAGVRIGFDVPIIMPAGFAVQENTHLCISANIPSKGNEYIIGIVSKPSPITHHVKVIQCQVPGYVAASSQSPSVWDCSESLNTSRGNLPQANMCTAGYKAMYSWIKGVEDMILPDGVGMPIGNESGGDDDDTNIVLQLHYAHLLEHPERMAVSDGREGIVLRLVSKSSGYVKHESSELRLLASGVILPNAVQHVESACRIDEPVIMHPLAFLGHTHKLGKVVSGWKISPDGVWSLIGKVDPVSQVSRYPIADKSLLIAKGDVVAARCTYNSLDHEVFLGDSLDDEMCRFDIWYYVSGDQLMKRKNCQTTGPPDYNWSKDPLVGHVPPDIDREASIID